MRVAKGRIAEKIGATFRPNLIPKNMGKEWTQVVKYPAKFTREKLF